MPDDPAKTEVSTTLVNPIGDLPEGFEAVGDGTHNITAMRTVPCGVHGLCELQVLFGPKRYHYQDVPIRLAKGLQEEAKHPGGHPTNLLNTSIKPHYHFYRADFLTGQPYKSTVREH